MLVYHGLSFYLVQNSMLIFGVLCMMQGNTFWDELFDVGDM